MNGRMERVKAALRERDELCAMCGKTYRRAKKSQRYCSRACGYRGRGPTYHGGSRRDFRGTLYERLDRHVVRSADCWIWVGRLNDAGYGVIAKPHPERPRMVRAHRVMYEREVGPIPGGLELDHLCRTRACVRPSHLEPVTKQENLRRGRLARGLTR